VNKVIDLIWAMARIEPDRITIVTPMDESPEANTVVLPQSIRIFGKEAIETLRDALNEAFPVKGE
jgi:hypothetical protein